MKKLLLLAAVLLPFASAHAEITVKGDDFELSKDCVRLSGDNISVKSDDCSSKSWDDKDKKGNASVHGDDNPGKGHNKDKKDKKK
ncbi:CG2 omega domain protein [Vibrio parahaemolyticus]|uniref:CG2 omega domain protein n=1 Tax=Vibrio parahaemolyticus TaxID=670 RepID=UPI00111E8D0D|nr:CG2 omega domain protein [Vibrio parahaemolyticus]EJG1082298.1 CG2 omega domain protein [Vibrio parahaemolyticus]MBM4973066.1 CG2 omega domain protein [Vibrio parahaemolyticus]MCQ9097643.1 CG2 omega domain protein [Vibrio parahaemolyticus]MDL2005766.1 CG2 omega domain protein [Vibrio parahaemolyticus]TOF59345.1 CG2 omega domain protein [Vibrio parahaemolyticus]